jgi:hypothetical protein
LADLYRAQGRYADALPLIQKTIANGSASPSVALPVLFAAQSVRLVSVLEAFNDGLNVVQRASQTTAATAVNNLAVRLAAGSDRLAQLVRRDQDLAAETVALDKAIVEAVSKEASKRNNADEQRIIDRVASITKEREPLRQLLANEFPGYAASYGRKLVTVRIGKAAYRGGA